jgi:hypothetical protein
MPDREGPKAALICNNCKHDTGYDCILTRHNNEYGTPADCPKLEQEEASVDDGKVYLWGYTVIDPEALATALLIAAQKARSNT